MTSSPEAALKTSFCVYNAGDGRRFRVHLNAADLPRLRVGKVRRTVAAVAKIDPDGFTMYVDGRPLDDDAVTAAEAGVTPDVLVCLRPTMTTTTTQQQQQHLPTTAAPPTATTTSSTPPRRRRSPSPVRDVPAVLDDDDEEDEVERRRHADANAETLWRHHPRHPVADEGYHHGHEIEGGATTVSVAGHDSNVGPAYEDDDDDDDAEPDTDDCLGAFPGLSAKQRDLQMRWLGDAVKAGVVAPSTSRSRSRTRDCSPNDDDARQHDHHSHQRQHRHQGPDRSFSRVDESRASDPQPAMMLPQTIVDLRLRPTTTTGGAAASPPLSSSSKSVRRRDENRHGGDVDATFSSPIGERSRYDDHGSDPPPAVVLAKTAAACERPHRAAAEHIVRRTVASVPVATYAASSSAAPTTINVAPTPVSGSVSHNTSNGNNDVAEAWHMWQADAATWANERAALVKRAEAAEARLEGLDEIDGGVEHLADEWRAERAEARRLASAVDAMKSAVVAAERERDESKRELAHARAALDAARLSEEERAQVLSAAPHIADTRSLRRELEAARATAAQASADAANARRVSEALKGGMRVVVRLRPALPADSPVVASVTSDAHLLTMQNTDVIADATRGSVVAVLPNGAPPKTFEFTRVHHDGATQQDLYDADVAPIVRRVLDGVNACVLAYGQTGSGKTHTVFGTDDEPGFLHRAFQQIFDTVGAAASSSSSGSSSGGSGSVDVEDGGAFSSALPRCHVELSVFELHLDTARDLLAAPAGATSSCGPTSSNNNNRPRMALSGKTSDAHHRHVSRLQTDGARCPIRVTSIGAEVVGLTRHTVSSAADASDVVRRAAAERHVRETGSNATSSRSHAFVTVTVSHGGVSARLMVVDLAGSERVAKSLSAGDSLKEAQAINASLSALGDVIHARAAATNGNASSSAAASRHHIPFRNTKLTALLQPCLATDNSIGLMIACIAPTWVAKQTSAPTQAWRGEDNTEESLSTLAFASRAKCVRSVLLTRAPYTAAASASSSLSVAGATHSHQYEVPTAHQHQQQHQPARQVRSGSSPAPTRNGTATTGLRAASPAATNAGVKHQMRSIAAAVPPAQQHHHQYPVVPSINTAAGNATATSTGGSSTPRRWMR